MGLFDRIKQETGGVSRESSANQPNHTRINTLRLAIRHINSQIYDKQTKIDSIHSVIKLTQESIKRLEEVMIRYERNSYDYLFCQSEINKKQSFIKEKTASNNIEIPELEKELKELENEKESFEKKLRELEN